MLLVAYCDIIQSGDNMATFGEIIKEKRIEQGLSQNKLSKTLGISQSYMNQIENGVRNPNFELLCKICKLLEISIPWEGPEDET